MNNSDLSPKQNDSSNIEMKRLVHELQTHQIELKLQNEELIRSRNIAETATQKYTELYDFSPWGYITLTSEGEITNLNLEATKILGQVRSKLLKSFFHFYISNEYHEDFHSFIKMAFKKQSQNENFFECKINNGSGNNLHVSMKAILDKDLNELYLVMTDITKRAELEEQKTAFLARMSHEIRTPLNGIIGCCDLISLDDLSKKDKDIMEMIFISSDRLKKTVDEILDFSKIQNREMRVVESYIEIRELIKNVLSMIESIRIKKNDEVFININPQVPEKIFSDPRLLERILINLLSNSYKFTTSGKIHIEIDLESPSKKDSLLKFCIYDTGIGIDANYLPFIFDPYSQENESLTREFEGTGLGMPIVKKLVNLLGGKIKVESEKGKGTKIEFTIRAKEVYEIPSGILPLEKRVRQLSNFSTKFPLKVLIVDDDEISLTAEKKFLELMGYTPDLARNGLEALEAYKNKHHDLIFMDVRMPVMDGIEATKGILDLKWEKRPVIIAASGDTTNEIFYKCKMNGMNDFITKPFRKEEIGNIIQKHFKNKNSFDQKIF